MLSGGIAAFKNPINPPIAIYLLPQKMDKTIFAGTTVVNFDKVTVTPTVASGTFTYYSGGYNEAEVHEEVIALLREGVLDGRIWLNIEQPFALDDINLAFDAVKNRQLVKALVQLGD